MQIKYWFIVLNLFVWGACTEDKGHYDYREINEISISGIQKEYSAYTEIGKLEITPTIRFSQDSLSADRYEYQWSALPDYFSNDRKEYILSKERNLNYKVELPQNEYILLFKITDKQTDVVWSVYTNLTINTIYTNGWLLLGDDQGKAIMDMVSIPGNGDTLLMKDVMKDNGLPPLKGPRKIVSVNTYGTYDGLFLMTDDGGYELDKLTFGSSEGMNIKNQVFADVSDRFCVTDIVQGGSLARVMFADSSIFMGGAFDELGLFGNPINKYSADTTETFRVMPELAWQSVASWGSNFSYGGKLLAFDDEQKQFVKFDTYSSYCQTMTANDNEGDAFKWKSGNDLVALFNSRYRDPYESQYTSYSIMRSPDGHYYIYSFFPVKAKKGKAFDITTLPDIDKARCFCFSGEAPYMFYVVGSKLYGCEFLTTGVEVQLEKDFGQEITLLFFDTFKEGKEAFYVATYDKTNTDNTGGTVQKFYVKDNPNKIEIEEVKGVRWEKTCKVVFMAWKWR